jgi:porin
MRRQHRARMMTRFVAIVCLSLTTLPGAAHAACNLPEDPFGVPEEEEGEVDLDIGGVRDSLADAGIGVGATYYGEAFMNWGGIQDGGAYDGVLELYLNADMPRLGLWKGLCFYTNGYQIHGRSITDNYVGSLMAVSSIEADPSTRLFELWFEQSLFNEMVLVRLGQLAADVEFILSEGGSYFLNGTWGWPSIASADLPGGGPAYPLATPGVRIALAPSDKINLLLGVFNGDPAPDCNKAGGDPERCNPHGLDFELDAPPLLLAEGAYSYALAGGTLPGTIKLGGWNHFGEFEELSAHPGGISGRLLKHDWALYGIIDQLLWRVPGVTDPHGVAIFARVVGAPKDRNLVDFYFDGGFTFSGMVAGRPDDVLAIGFAYTGLSSDATGIDFDIGTSSVPYDEWLIEIAYTFKVSEGWLIQPDFQYIGNPVEGSDDATIVGARTTLNF